jgi:hypothetical protein
MSRAFAPVLGANEVLVDDKSRFVKAHPSGDLASLSPVLVPR